ncbi:MAG TPA: hypothetical protein P5154_03200 [Candidatus Izemoplasmatales bacterium]|nr:hypothetical protein [Bacillota bacterium]HRY77749.1 hypothetical protein [Candidatus Izemoplasmatales bacterium]
MNDTTDSRSVQRFQWRPFALRVVVYSFGLALLGVCVTLMLKTNLGMDAWDAFYRNLNEGIPLDYRYLNPIIALILLPIAYAMQKKRVTIWILFPLIVSAYVGWVIDELKEIIPDVSGENLGWNILYLGASIPICAVGLNMVTFCRFPLPALDELCFAIGKAMKSTYGKGKLVGELLALVLTVITGLIYHRQSDWFNIGVATVVFGFGIGPMIDWLKKPVYRGLEGLKIW